MMYGAYNYGWGPGNMMGWFSGGIMMLAFWVLVVALIIWVVRGTKNNSQSDSKAIDILKERYAKGEISKEEFETKRKDISQA